MISLRWSPARRLQISRWARLSSCFPPGTKSRNAATALRPNGQTTSIARLSAAAPIVGSHLPARQIRGKKTRTTVKLDDLPQGPLAAANPLPPKDDGPAYPTVVLQARRNMRKFDNCVLLTRVGGFYELYFEHAEEFGPLLNLKVAQKKTNAGPVPMAGFPFFQLDRFLKILVQDLNRYVAIAEEFPNDPSEKIKSGGLMHDRRVARIITPGTLIDENFMDPYANNYVMAIHLPDPEMTCVSPTSTEDRSRPVAATANESTPVGLAWLDLSTGGFFTQATSLPALGSVLSRVSPREIVLDKELQARPDADIFSILADDRHLVTYAPRGALHDLSSWAPMLESEVPPEAADTFTEDELRAGSLLLDYVKNRLQGLSMKLQPPLRHESMQVMSIDKNSMRSLELKQTIRDGAFRGSLLHAIRRTVTKSGARLLNEWLCSPSTSIDAINFRQDLVARFIQQTGLRDTVAILLRRSHDSHRLVQKFALNRGDPDDLLGIASTIKATEDIVSHLKHHAAVDTSPSGQDCLSVLVDRISLEKPQKLAARIREAIDEEGLVQQHQLEDSESGEMMALAQEIVSAEGSEEDASMLPRTSATKTKKKGVSIRNYYGEDNEVWTMKPGASKALLKLHGELEELRDDKDALAEQLRSQFNAPSLTLRWTPGLGHICHVKGKDVRNSEAPTRTLSSSRSTRSFHQPEWTALGERMDKIRLRIRGEEQRVFAALREQVVINLVKLRRNAAVLDELDITTSFARLAVEQRLTRPKLNNSTAHTIIGGRHPTVEGGLTEAGRTFQRNDCFVGSPGHGLAWLITGPNMAGKSTFLRQNALITILAQVGCYVPADYAEMGIVDAIFSRVGSADNLYRDQSTFMVEMLETTAILRHATPRSFVIMDEIGRGTTPEDGTAVAFASLHHLVHVNKCRALFATHFHTVADLVAAHGMRVEDGGEQGAVDTYCTDVEEDGAGGFVYVHKLRKGINRQSHALKVAHLAGLPEPAIRIAQQVLQGLGAAGTTMPRDDDAPGSVVGG